MKMLEQKMTDFIEVLSSKEPVPGGGGACAAVGAMGMALGLMVANLTAGKKKYVANEERIQEILTEAMALRKEIEGLADKDAEVFEPLSRAYGLPRETRAEKEHKEQIMEKCLYAASQVPIELMEKVLKSMEILEELSEIGSTIAISDVGVGAQFARSALNGGALNVFINTRLMKDMETAERLNSRAEELLEEGNAKADVIYNTVRAALQ